jgi:O-antigen/teichoic acid export membrane protein
MKKNFLNNIYLTLIAIILNFAFKIYLASIIPKVSLGIYYTMIDLISLFLLVFIGSRSSMVVYYNQTQDDKTILNLFRYSLVLVTIISLIFIIPFAKDFLQIEISYLFFALLLISQAIYTYFFNQLGIYRLYKETNVITIFEVSFIIVLFFVFNYFIGYFESLILATVANFLVLSGYILYKKPSPEPSFAKIDITPQTKEFISNSFIASLEFALGMLSIYISVIFFTKYFTLFDLADFQVVVKSIYFYFLALFVFPIFKFVFPELSLLVTQNNTEELKRLQSWIFKYSLIVTVIASILTFVLSSYGIVYLFGQEYENSTTLLLPLILVYFFVIQNGFLSSLLKSKNGFKATFTIRFIGILVFIASFYVLELFTHQAVNVIYAFLIGHLITYALLKIVSRES